MIETLVLTDVKGEEAAHQNGRAVVEIAEPERDVTLLERYPRKQGERYAAYDGRITAYDAIQRDLGPQGITDLREGQQSRLEARRRGEVREPLVPIHSLYDNLPEGQTVAGAHIERFNAWRQEAIAAQRPLNGVSNEKK